MEFGNGLLQVSLDSYEGFFKQQKMSVCVNSFVNI